MSLKSVNNVPTVKRKDFEVDWNEVLFIDDLKSIDERDEEELTAWLNWLHDDEDLEHYCVWTLSDEMSYVDDDDDWVIDDD